MVKSHGMNPLNGLHAYCSRDHAHHPGDRFGRLFPDAPALFTNPTVLEEMGRPGGVMDDAGAPAKTTSVDVGQVFFGQFVDHDITLDASSSFEQVNVPEETQNVRTPTLDLDCVYGLGPEAMPFMYHTEGPFKGVKLLTGADLSADPLAADDLPRVAGRALIGDPRNDENRVVSQVQLAMIRFHNRMCDDLASEHEGSALYEEAHRLTTWHYQWAVVHDFLTSICGPGVVQEVLSEGRRIYRPKVPFMPVEFSVAAYRFGHSMVPMKVQLQKGKAAFELFGPIFGEGFSAITDARAVADMHELFTTHEGRHVQRAEALDSKLATDLLQLPIPVVGASEASLATRNLVRGQSFLLPSGETVAALCERPEAEIAQISDAAKAEVPGLAGGTPLWYYLLKEAALIGRMDAAGGSEPGEGLGPVGARIVAEVIIGLIELDRRSWLGANRNWRPLENQDLPGVKLDTVGHILTYR